MRMLIASLVLCLSAMAYAGEVVRATPERVAAATAKHSVIDGMLVSEATTSLGVGDPELTTKWGKQVAIWWTDDKTEWICQYRTSDKMITVAAKYTFLQPRKR